MKIKLAEDYIYTCSGFSSVLILHNCDSSCSFCPASKLKSFYNYAELNQIFDYDSTDLTIYGNVKCTYIETFLKKAKALNPKLSVKIVGCECEFSQNIDVEYNHVIHPSLVTYFSIMPSKFIIPALGEFKIVLSFAKRFRSRYPNVEVVAKIFDAPDSNIEFWSEEQVQDFNKQVNI